jgi:hypothetical protein
LRARTFLLCVIALFLTSGTLFVGSSSAQAATVCGAGYSFSDEYQILNDVTDSLIGYADLYYSSAAKRNCLVVSHSSSTWGTRLHTIARIRPSGLAWPSCPKSVGCDEGNYQYYAGPVYTPAGFDMSHHCVDLYGNVGNASGKTVLGVHCG